MGKLEYFPANNPTQITEITDIRNPSKVDLHNLNKDYNYKVKIYSQYGDYPDSEAAEYTFVMGGSTSINNNSGNLQCYSKSSRNSAESVKVCDNGKECQSIIRVSQSWAITNEDEKDCVSLATAKSNFDLNSDKCYPGSTSIDNAACYLYCNEKNLCNDRIMTSTVFECSTEGRTYNCDPTKVTGQTLGYNKDDC